jgi:hypothetical protein
MYLFILTNIVIFLYYLKALMKIKMKTKIVVITLFINYA